MTRVSAGILVALLSVRVIGGFGEIPPSSQASTRKYNIAVARADGVLIPFAQFDRGVWRPFWTGADHSLKITVPATLDDVSPAWWRDEPPSMDWTLWRDEGGPLAVRAKAPRVVYTPCSTQVALATDLRPPADLPPPHQAPFPKIGLASTAPIDIEPIEAVPPNDTDWMRVKRALGEKEFRVAENTALGDMGWNHPVKSIERDRAAIDLQAVWHVKDSRFFYFEAMRRYPDPKPPKGKPACELVTYVAGYFWEERSENLRPVGVNALVTYCHMERATFLWPFGVIREGGKQFWVFQSAGWTGEVYGITEPMASKGFVRPHLWHVAGRCR